MAANQQPQANQSGSDPSANSSVPDTLVVAGHTFYRANILKSNHHVSNHHIHLASALIDRGANGCMIGNDMVVLEESLHHVDLTGIVDHSVPNLSICTAAGLALSQHGLVNIIVFQAAHFVI